MTGQASTDQLPACSDSDCSGERASIVRYVKDEDVAYDILQETFIRSYYKANTYNSAYKFSTRLYQIAFNLCHDWGRKQKLRKFYRWA